MDSLLKSTRSTMVDQSKRVEIQENITFQALHQRETDDLESYAKCNILVSFVFSLLNHCEKCHWKTGKSCRCTVYLKNRRSPKNDSGRRENRPRCGCCGERRMKSTWRGEQKKASGRLFLLTLGSKRAFSSHFESFLRSFSG